MYDNEKGSCAIRHARARRRHRAQGQGHAGFIPHGYEWRRGTVFRRARARGRHRLGSAGRIKQKLHAVAPNQVGQILKIAPARRRGRSRPIWASSIRQAIVISGASGAFICMMPTRTLWASSSSRQWRPTGWFSGRYRHELRAREVSVPAVPFVHAAHLPIDLFKFVFGELRNLFNQMQSIIKFMADRSPDRDRPQLVLPEKARPVRH